MTLVPFVDIAHWQGNVDFRKMAAQGVKAVLCKVSQGRTPDPKWLTYARDAKAAGLFVGGYMFLDVTSSASPAEQASLFLRQLEAGQPTMLHMYDCEWDGGSSANDAARIAYYEAVMSRVDGALGKTGAIYTIRSFWSGYCANTAAFNDHDLIVAAPLSGMPPAHASGWDAWAAGRGPAAKYYPVGTWSGWSAWQFAVPPGSGPTYGAQSTAIDMDLVKPDVFARWTNQLVQEEDVPLDQTDINKIVAALSPVISSQVTAVLRSPEFKVNFFPQVVTQVAAVEPHLDVLDTSIAAIPTTSVPGGDGGGVTEQQVRDIINATHLTTDEA